MRAIVSVAGRRSQSGLTLIELMVSLTIGLVILGALGYAYLGSRGAYRTNENLARMQESGRFALDLLTQDLRMGGFIGCRSRLVGQADIVMVARPPVSSNFGGSTFQGAADAIIGFESGTGWTNPSSVPRVAGDVVTIRRATAGIELSASADIPNARVTLRDNSPNFRKGDYVALGTCSRVAIFRVSNEPGVGSNVVLEYQPTISGSGYTSADGNGNNGVVSGPTSYQLLGAGAFDLAARPAAYRFAEISYFIGNNPAGRPALYRVATNQAAEEIADNVEDMDILYGIDDNNDLFADRYVTASDITTPADWARVVAVRVSLLVASPDLGSATNTQQVALRDTTGDGVVDLQSTADTRLRQVFSSTVSLRNRSP